MAASSKTLERREAKLMGETIAETTPGVRKIDVFVGTWMSRAGKSITLHLDSKSTGRRIVVHKWDDEFTCSVRLIEGDGWRDPDNFVELGRVDDVDYAAYNISLVAVRDLGVRS